MEYFVSLTKDSAGILQMWIDEESSNCFEVDRTAKKRVSDKLRRALIFGVEYIKVTKGERDRVISAPSLKKWGKEHGLKALKELMESLHYERKITIRDIYPSSTYSNKEWESVDEMEKFMRKKVD